LIGGGSGQTGQLKSKGKPITNSVVESLEMLDNLPDLDYVLIEDWLFQKPK